VTLVVQLPLGRKLPLLISGLILLVLVAASGAAYVEVERSAWTTANERVASLAGQLASLTSASVVARGAMMKRVATDTAVRRMLRSRVTGALDTSHGVSEALDLNREFQTYLTQYGETQKVALEILEKLVASEAEKA